MQYCELPFRLDIVVEKPSMMVRLVSKLVPIYLEYRANIGQPFGLVLEFKRNLTLNCM